VKRPDDSRLNRPVSGVPLAGPRIRAPRVPEETSRQSLPSGSPRGHKGGGRSRVRRQGSRGIVVSGEGSMSKIPTTRKISASAQARRELRTAVAARKASERNEIRRFTAHVRRRRQAALGIGASLVGLVAFVAVGTFSPQMSLRTVTVLGTERVDSALISAGVASQLGKPLPLVDVEAIRQVIARQPLVKSFAIEAKPPHDLVIHITERSPAGYLKSSSGFTLVDAAGVTIEETPERTLALPVIDVTGASPTSRGFPAAMAVLSALPPDVRAQVDRVAASTKDDVTLFLNPTGSRVIWGAPEQSALKARVLGSLLGNFPLGAVGQYDVSAPNSPVVS